MIMKRRDLLKQSAHLALAGVALNGTRISGSERICESGGSNLPRLAAEGTFSETRPLSVTLSRTSAEDHRRRLVNISECEHGIRRCLRRQLIQDYLPGQVVYNLGEYPCRKPWDPDDWDEQELDWLRDHGIQLLQVHEEWNDSQRLFGGHKLAR